MSSIPDPDWCKFCGWQMGGVCRNKKEAAQCPSPAIRARLREERMKPRKVPVYPFRNIFTKKGKKKNKKKKK